ncbi:hypothetical protein ACUH7Y_11730 [Clostridium beijerinckii]
MKKKVVILVLAGILTVSGVSLVYAANSNDIGLTNYILSTQYLHNIYL